VTGSGGGISPAWRCQALGPQSVITSHTRHLN